MYNEKRITVFLVAVVISSAVGSMTAQALTRKEETREITPIDVIIERTVYKIHEDLVNQEPLYPQLTFALTLHTAHTRA